MLPAIVVASALLAHASYFIGRAGAQITLDGTVGPKGALQGPDFTIGADLGTQRGGNLFHSFGDFNVHRGESATFTGPGSIESIIGRVTGGNASSIDGRLASDIPGADLYLINPAGVMFGPDATLDVKGSFAVSTADYLSLGDGGRFDAKQPGNSVLTAAPPTAFGFLGPRPAPIELDHCQLAVPEGQTLSIVAGDVQMNGATVRAPQGRVDLASVAAPGEVVRQLPGTSTDLNVGSFADLGDVVLSDGTEIDSSGTGGGQIVIRAGRFELVNSALHADTLGDAAGAAIDMRVGSLRLRDESAISADTWSSGDAGDVRIVATHGISVDGGGVFAPYSVISSDSLSERPAAGDGGTVSLTARSVSVDGGVVSVITAGGGRGGTLTVAAEDVSITGGGLIDASPSGGGDAGTVDIAAAGAFSVGGRDSNGFVSAVFSGSCGSGDGAAIVVSAGDLSIEEGQIGSQSFGPGAAGPITVNARTLALTRGGQIATSTQGRGDAGSLTVNVADSLDILGRDEKGIASGIYSVSQEGTNRGAAGAISVEARTLSIDDGRISSNNFGDGRGGFVQVETGDLSIAGGGEISASTAGRSDGGTVMVSASDRIALAGRNADGEGSRIQSESFGAGRNAGNAGAVTVSASVLTIDDGRISSNTFGTASGGSVNVSADEMTISGGGDVSVSTFASGDAGTVTVSVADSLSIVGSSERGRSGIFSSTERSNAGSAGGVSVSAARLAIDGGIISSATVSSGNGGVVQVAAGDIALIDGGVIDSTTFASGNAGMTSVAAEHSLTIAGRNEESVSGIFSSSEAESSFGGDAGEVVVSAESLDVQGGSISTRTQGGGRGGAVTITAPDVSVSEGGQISAETSGIGDAGEIKILAQNMLSVHGRDVEGSLSAILTSSVSGRAQAGKAGSLTLDAGTISIDGGTVSSATFGGGMGGSVRVDANDIVISGGGSISASTTGRGDAGAIVMLVTDTLGISGHDLENRASGIVSSSDATGDSGAAGRIEITARELTLDGQLAVRSVGEGAAGGISLDVRDLTLQSGSTISASSASTVLPGGSVAIRAQNLVTVDGGAITAQAAQTGGGNVSIEARDIRLSDASAVTASVGGGEGSGGNVGLTADTIVARDDSDITANAVGGQGGNITVTAQTFFRCPECDVDASSQFSEQGTVQINSPDTNLAGVLARLSENLLRADELFPRSCARGESSSFVVRAAEGVPLAPDLDTLW